MAAKSSHIQLFPINNPATACNNAGQSGHPAKKNHAIAVDKKKMKKNNKCVE